MSNWVINEWYCAGWSHELTEKPLSRRILDMPIVLFRGTDGKVAALADRCPHRFAPLSMGKIEGDTIICGYHGLAVNRDGTCLASPFNAQIPSGRTVRHYPIVEKHGAIWIWPGDPENAKEDEIADFAFLDQEPGPHGYMHVQAGYRLILDNLLDLSHIEHVHLRTFGGAGAFYTSEHRTDKVSDREIWSRWWMPNVRTPVPARRYFEAETVDHWQDMRWTAPSNCVHELGLLPVGADRIEASSKRSAHLITPETDTTSHYFYSLEGAEGPNDAAGADLARIAFEEEDRPMIEAVQRNMVKDFWDERPIVLGTDSTGILVRRTLDKMARAEQQEIS